jgi:hypothetical protein
MLINFRRLCEQHRDSAHEKTRALAREFLNDWEAVWIVVAHPHLPSQHSALALLGKGCHRAAQRQPGALATRCRLIWGNGNRGG